MLLATTAAALFEAALRLCPGILGGYVANVAYTGYHSYSGGIYRLDAHVGPLMRPTCDARCTGPVIAGRTRPTNAGFRGPCPARTDVVFLGDSMIYGHGVENDATVPSRFAALTGLGTANLGQQGTSLVQSWLIFERKGVPLAPHVVFVAAHPTDVEDAITVYEPQMLSRWLRSAPGSFEPIVREQVPATGSLQPRPSLARGDRPAARRGRRLWRALASLARGPAAGTPGAARGDERFVPSDVLKPFVAPRAPPDSDERLGWEAQRRALLEIRRAAAAIGARVVVFDLGYPREFSRAIEEAAADLGLAYSPAGRRVVERALAGEDLYLARDGHWNPAGCEAIARELAPLASGPAEAATRGPQ